MNIDQLEVNVPDMDHNRIYISDLLEMFRKSKTNHQMWVKNGDEYHGSIRKESP